VGIAVAALQALFELTISTYVLDKDLASEFPYHILDSRALILNFFLKNLAQEPKNILLIQIHLNSRGIIPHSHAEIHPMTWQSLPDLHSSSTLLVQSTSNWHCESDRADAREIVRTTFWKKLSILTYKKIFP